MAGSPLSSTPYREGQTSPFTAVPSEQLSQINNQYQVASVTGNPNVLPPTLTAAQAYQSGFTQQPGFGQLYRFNTQTRNYELNPQTGADKTATSAPGNGDFYGYNYNPETGQSERVLKNAATASFYNELRWDPESKKYQKIGNLIRQGKLDLSGKKGKKRRGGGGGGQQQQQTAAPEPSAQYTGSVSGNFNTGTG